MYDVPPLGLKLLYHGGVAGHVSLDKVTGIVIETKIVAVVYHVVSGACSLGGSNPLPVGLVYRLGACS